jgi:hypothetical protein
VATSRKHTPECFHRAPVHFTGSGELGKVVIVSSVDNAIAVFRACTEALWGRQITSVNFNSHSPQSIRSRFVSSKTKYLMARFHQLLHNC